MAGEMSQEELDALLASNSGGAAAAPATKAESKAEATKVAASNLTASELEGQVKKIEELTAAQSDKSVRPEIGAATLARMAGLATSSEIKVLEGKLDLLSGRVANMTLRVERVLTMLGNMPSGSDLERIDVNVASLKTMLRELTESVGAAVKDDPNDKVTKAKLDAFLKRHSGAKDGEGGAGEEPSAK